MVVVGAHIVNAADPVGLLTKAAGPLRDDGVIGVPTGIEDFVS